MKLFGLILTVIGVLWMLWLSLWKTEDTTDDNTMSNNSFQEANLRATIITISGVILLGLSVLL